MEKHLIGEIFLKTKHFVIKQDSEVPIPGFFIVTSKRKIHSFADFKDDEKKEFIDILCKLRKGMRSVLKIKDVYFFQNEDSEWGFHLWVFPRYRWMEKFGRKIQSVRPIMEHAKKNMTTEKDIQKVHDTSEKMRKYMSLRN